MRPDGRKARVAQDKKRSVQTHGEGREEEGQRRDEPPDSRIAADQDSLTIQRWKFQNRTRECTRTFRQWSGRLKTEEEDTMELIMRNTSNVVCCWTRGSEEEHSADE